MKFFEIKDSEFYVFVRQRNRICLTYLSFLDLYSQEDYMEMGSRLFLSVDLNSGSGIKPSGRELIYVFF